MDMRNPEVFEGKSFQDLLKDIYDNSRAKKAQIKTLMDVLAEMLKKPTARPTDAAVIAPLVKEFLDVAVKNDEHLVKIATIMQRLMSAETVATGAGGISDILSEDEKNRLLEEVEKEVSEDFKLSVEEEKQIDDLKEKTQTTLKKLSTKESKK